MLPRLTLAIAVAALFSLGNSAFLQDSKTDSPPPPKREEPKRPLRVRVSESVSQAFIAKKVQPDYPPEARAKHVEGRVVMKAEISESGDVQNISLISGDPLLAPAAMEAVKQWKYKPYLLNGQPVNVETQVTVVFQLTR